MRAVVVDVICQRLSFLVKTGNAAAYRGFAVIILSEILRIGKHSLEELKRHDFGTVVVDLVNTCHAYVLDNAQMRQIFLAECHPETRAPYCREIQYKRLQFLVIEQIGLARADIGVGEGTVEFQRACGHPFAGFIITAVLGDFAYVYFRVEIGCESFAVVAGVAVHYIKRLHLAEIVFGGIGGEHSAYTRVEAATEDSRQTGIFETLAVCPLP